MGKYVIHDFLKESYPISQPYGANIDYYKNITQGGLTHGHEGVDFKTPNGTEIFAPFDGIIVRDSFDPKSYGSFIVIWDPVQLCALWFCHLKDSVVKIQDTVKAGQLLGHSNNTGNTTGPHVHVNFVETDKNGIRLHTENGEEGFLNIMDPSLVSYPWKPCAAIVPPSSSVVTTSTAKLKIGDIINVTIDIPVGKDIGTENFSYGKVSPDHPAKVTNIMVMNDIVYYDVDQSAIGGGTGWVRADAVDANLKASTSQSTSPSPALADSSTPVAPPQSSGTTNTPVSTTPSFNQIDLTDQLKEMELQRNDALAKAKEMTDKYDKDMSNYTALIAAGFSTVEDIDKAMKDLRDENSGIKTELRQVLERNAQYHLDMAAKEREDATAIEIGMNFEKKYNDLKSDLSALAKMYKVKPNFQFIAQVIEDLKSAYANASRELKQQSVKESIETATEKKEDVGQSTSLFTQAFLTLFGFRKAKEGGENKNGK